ncbi:MAG TPA: DoxX family protein [Micromonosporaceae bacterium]
MTTTDSNAAVSRAGVGKAANIALWVLQALLAFNFAFAAIGKFTGNEQMVATFDKIGWGDWFMYVIAVLELAGVVGLLIPRLSGLAALGFVGLMVGAVITEAVVGGFVVFPLVLLVLAAIVAYGRRDRTAALLSGSRG